MTFKVFDWLTDVCPLPPRCASRSSFSVSTLLGRTELPPPLICRPADGTQASVRGFLLSVLFDPNPNRYLNMDGNSLRKGGKQGGRCIWSIQVV